MKPIFGDGNAKPFHLATDDTRGDASPSSAPVLRDAAKTVREASAELLTDDQIDQLGATAGERVASLSQRLLSEARASDADHFGELLNNLIVTAKGLDPASIQKRGLAGKLVSMFRSTREQLLAQFDSVEKRIGTLVVELEATASRQNRDIAELDQMYADNYETFRQFEAAKAHGEASLESYRVALAQEPQAGDAFAAQRMMDTRRRANALAQKIDDLSRAMLMAEQLAPQIRMEQDHKRTLISKFGTAKTVLIPAWTNAFSLYIKQLSSKKAADLANATFDAADMALRAQADQLHANAGAVTRLAERPVIATETFEYTQQKLFAALDEMAKIIDEGQRKRKADEPRLRKLEQDLIARFNDRNH
ncbi:MULTISPECIES: toxic anion resistance protein [unclassified Caballeronia]|uniref:toxic anion resistance protein n=1 Tax=unclassified Caballeronia TaxID=2646786 RepID=UPI001FD1075D|nr:MULTISPECIES: toxic anion resistance protein [unclassified Caballeronia]